MNDDRNEIAKRQKAVALEQQGDHRDIPRITASGVGTNAEKILRLAFDNDVNRETSSQSASFEKMKSWLKYYLSSKLKVSSRLRH